jgi:hypothetical protein
MVALAGSLADVAAQDLRKIWGRARGYEGNVVAFLNLLLKHLGRKMPPKRAFEVVTGLGEALLYQESTSGSETPTWRRVIVFNHDDEPVERVDNVDKDDPSQAATPVVNLQPGQGRSCRATPGTEFGVAVEGIKTILRLAGPKVATVVSEVDQDEYPDELIATEWLWLRDYDSATGHGILEVNLRHALDTDLDWHDTFLTHELEAVDP